MPKFLNSLALAFICSIVPALVAAEDRLVGEARNAAIAKLGAVYGELAALDQILLSDMEAVGKSKDM